MDKRIKKSEVSIVTWVTRKADMRHSFKHFLLLYNYKELEKVT